MNDKQKSDFDSYEVSNSFDSPAAGQTITHTTDIDGQISEVDITADSPVQVELKTQDASGATNVRNLRSYVGDDLGRLDFEDGLAEVGANREVILELVAVASATIVSLNFTVDEYKA